LIGSMRAENSARMEVQASRDVGNEAEPGAKFVG
jgi:hypothetical protein